MRKLSPTGNVQINSAMGICRFFAQDNDGTTYEIQLPIGEFANLAAKAQSQYLAERQYYPVQGDNQTAPAALVRGAPRLATKTEVGRTATDPPEIAIVFDRGLSSEVVIALSERDGRSLAETLNLVLVRH